MSECIEGDCINGFGTSQHSDGSQYIGNWKEGETKKIEKWHKLKTCYCLENGIYLILK